MYLFVGDTDLFDLDPYTGWITVKGTLDRDTQEVRQRGGVYALYVQVRIDFHSSVLFTCYIICFQN